MCVFREEERTKKANEWVSGNTQSQNYTYAEGEKVRVNTVKRMNEVRIGVDERVKQTKSERKKRKIKQTKPKSHHKLDSFSVEQLSIWEKLIKREIRLTCHVYVLQYTTTLYQYIYKCGCASMGLSLSLFSVCVCITNKYKYR